MRRRRNRRRKKARVKKEVGIIIIIITKIVWHDRYLDHCGTGRGRTSALGSSITRLANERVEISYVSLSVRDIGGCRSLLEPCTEISDLLLNIWILSGSELGDDLKGRGERNEDDGGGKDRLKKKKHKENTTTTTTTPPSPGGVMVDFRRSFVGLQISPPYHIAATPCASSTWR